MFGFYFIYLCKESKIHRLKVGFYGDFTTFKIMDIKTTFNISIWSGLFKTKLRIVKIQTPGRKKRQRLKLKYRDKDLLVLVIQKLILFTMIDFMG